MSPRVLLVSGPQQQSRLLEVLEGREFQIDCATGLLDALVRIGGAPHRYDLFLVDAELHDGSWHDLVEFSRNSEMAVPAIVCARLGDHQLWAEVLESGGYDLIVEPYVEREVTRILEGALNLRSVQSCTRPVLGGSP